MEKRIESIDFLRGFAALWVCWFHLTHQNTIIDDGILKSIGTYGWSGVEIFFVISGFIIPYALNRAGYTFRRFPTFLLKRIARLDPPYLVSIVLVLAVAYACTLAPHYDGDRFQINAVQLLLHLGYLNVLAGYEWLSPVYWTLAIEFQYYLIMGLTFPLVSSRTRLKRLLFFVVLGLLAWRITSGSFIFHFIFLFFMGIALFQYSAGIIDRLELLILLPLFTVGALWLMGVPGTLAGLFAAGVISFLKVKNRAFLFLGTISYSLYLVHPPAVRVVYTLGRRFATGPAGKTALFFVALGTTIAAAYLLYLVVERPAQRWSSSLRYQNRSKGKPEAQVTAPEASAEDWALQTGAVGGEAPGVAV